MEPDLRTRAATRGQKPNGCSEPSGVGSPLAGSDWLAIALLSAFAAACLSWSWQGWSSPFYDVGRELYTAWAISDGASLYGDIWLPRGPLSSYWNGLVFETFGASMLTLAISNLSILAVGIAVLYALIRRHHGTPTAALAIFLLLGVFAFARYDTMGNYNFVLPYAHEVTQGLVLSLVAMALVLRSLRGAGTRCCALAAGFFLGLVLLTKQEIAVAAVMATAGTLLTARSLPLRRRMLILGSIGLGASPPLLTTLVALGTAPFAMMWNPSIGEVVRDSPFYLANLGLDRPGEHLREIGLATLVLTLELLFVSLAARRLRAASNAQIAVAAVIYALLHIVLIAYGPVPAERLWLAAPKILLPLILLVALSSITRRGLSANTDPSTAFICWLSIFAAFMLLKLGLYPRIHYYGFAQALPATMVVVVVLVSTMPRWLGRFRVDTRFVGVAMTCLLVGFCLYSVSLARHAYAQLGTTTGTGTGVDAFRGPRSDRHHQRVLGLLSQRVSSGDTLLVLPEGVLFNYLLRVRNPTPHISFLPFELALAGEQRVVKDLAANPPDHVLLMPRNVQEYGFREFGQAGYGDEIIAWLHEHYDGPAGSASRRPRLLKRREALADPATGSR